MRSDERRGASRFIESIQRRGLFPVCHKALGLACNPLLWTDNIRARARVSMHAVYSAVICICAVHTARL